MGTVAEVEEGADAKDEVRARKIVLHLILIVGEGVYGCVKVSNDREDGATHQRGDSEHEVVDSLPSKQLHLRQQRERTLYSNRNVKTPPYFPTFDSQYTRVCVCEASCAKYTSSRRKVTRILQFLCLFYFAYYKIYRKQM